MIAAPIGRHCAHGALCPCSEMDFAPTLVEAPLPVGEVMAQLRGEARDGEVTVDTASPRNPLRGGFSRALAANEDAARSAAEALVGSRGIRAYIELVDLITEVEG